MKRIDLVTVALATAVTLGCDRGARNEARMDADQPDTVGTAGMASGADKAFVEDLGNAGMAEVQLGTLAKDRAASPEVKQFAEMMVRDHSASGEELKQIASRHAVAMPAQLDEKHRETMDRLSGIRGQDFDRAYMRIMVDSHEEVIDRLQTRANEDRFGDNKGAVQPERADNPVEASLNEWAAKKLPTTRHHLDEAKRIHRTLENADGTPAGAVSQPSSSRRER